MENLVDIFVPTYEPNPAFLREALTSIRNQTEGRFQVFIHDDASKVEVRALVSPFLEDKRFHFTRSIEHRGIGGNWNACLQYGDAPFIQYLFQDDRWYATYLETVLRIFQNFPKVGFVACDHDYDYEVGMENAPLYDEVRRTRTVAFAPGPHSGRGFLRFWIERGLHPNLIGEPPFVMLRRSITSQVGTFAEDMPQFLDVDFWIRTLQRTDFYYHPEELGVFRVHRNAASFRNDSAGSAIFDRFRCFERLLASIPKGPEHDAVRDARNRALAHMTRKFLDRLRQRKPIPMGAAGSGGFAAFCLRHPLLIGKATAQSLWMGRIDR